jgi:hypothetical protein
MHRHILGLSQGDPEVDHVNGDRLDNRRANLRFPPTRSEAMANQAKQQRLTSSRYKGVTWSKYAKRWSAQIKINRKMRYLGYFDTQEEAALAYNAAAIEVWGEFAHPNVV